MPGMKKKAGANRIAKMLPQIVPADDRQLFHIEAAALQLTNGLLGVFVSIEDRDAMGIVLEFHGYLL